MSKPLISKRFFNPSRQLLVAAGLALVVASCGKKPAEEPLISDFATGATAAAKFIDGAGKEVGTAAMIEGPTGTLLRVDMSGLTPGWHGIHFHMVGSCADHGDGFKASMGHVDPESLEHGLLNPAGYEMGDMPNLYAGTNGRATAEIFIPGVMVYPGEAAVAAVGESGILKDEDGFAIVIHAGADDHISQPIGGAGARVACAAFN